MVNGLLGKKAGMTQIFDNEGNINAVSVVEVGPCVVLELKDSPLKVKLGYDPIKESKLSKPQQGYFKKIKTSAVKVMKEFSSTDNKDYKVGQEIKADIFKPGDFVDVSGITIGKGFQGGMKRWNWSGGPGGHGSMHHRRVGSIGASADPSRVFRGTHMPGHMGARKLTVQNLRVLDVDTENNILVIKGAVPGHRNGYIVVRLSKKKKFESLEKKKAATQHKRNPMKQSKAKAKGKK